MLNRHWFIGNSPSGREIQGWDSRYCKTPEVWWCIDTCATWQRLSFGPGWSCRNPSLLRTWLLQDKFTVAEPRLPPRAGAAPHGSCRISGTPEREIFCMMVQGSASTSLPPLRADASSSGLIDLSWFCIQVSLHHHLQNLQNASSDTKLVGQVTISHPPAFTRATPGHTWSDAAARL